MAPTSTSKRHLGWLAAILLGTFLAYVGCLSNGFTYDDRAYVKVTTTGEEDNVMVRVMHPPWDYFTRPYGFGIHHSRGFRPVTVLSFALVHNAFRQALPADTLITPESNAYMDRGKRTVWSDPPWPHHLCNVLLHLLATFLVYRLVRVLLPGNVGAALIGAAVFALHAVHSDPVISIVGRAEILAFVFGAGATLLLADGIERRPGRMIGQLVLASCCLFLAFGSKESAVAWVGFLPVFLLARGWLCPEARGGKRLLPLLWHVWVVVLPLLVFLLLRGNAIAESQKFFGVAYESNMLFEQGALQRLPTAGSIYGYALWKMFVPWPLSSDYGGSVFAPVTSWFDPRFLASLIVLSGALLVGLLGARRWPLLFVATASYFGFSFLVSNIPIPIETIFAERIYYSSVLGMSFLAAWICTRLRAQLWRRVAVVVGVALVLVHGAIIVVRCSEWRDNRSLFLADAQRMPGSTSMLLNVAMHHRMDADSGDLSKWPEWRRYIDLAIERNPGSALPYNELGLHYLNRGDFAESEVWFEKANAAEHFEAERDALQIGLNMARLYWEWGKPGKQMQALERVVTARPDCMEAWTQMLWIAFDKRDKGLADRILQRARSQFPRQVGADGQFVDQASFIMHEGLWAFRAGDDAKAVHFLSNSLRSLLPAPQQIEAYVCLIKAHLRNGNKPQAGQLVRQVTTMLQGAKLSVPAKRQLELRYLGQLQRLARESGQ